MKSRLESLEQQLAKLEARASELGDDVREEYGEQLIDLRAKRDVARQKLEEMNRASGAAWEDVKEGAESVWHELEEALEKATSRFDEPSTTTTTG
jgi:chromosome segregation ATPase